MTMMIMTMPMTITITLTKTSYDCFGPKGDDDDDDDHDKKHNNENDDDDADEMNMTHYFWLGTVIAPNKQSSDGNFLVCHDRPGLGTPRVLTILVRVTSGFVCLML